MDTPEKPQPLAESRTGQLLALPLFSDLTEESSREALAFEVGLGTGQHCIPAEMPQRQSYLRFESHEPAPANPGSDLIVMPSGETRAIVFHGRRK